MERGELCYQEWKEAYAQLQSEKSVKKSDLQIVRHELIQAFNDEYYRSYADEVEELTDIDFFPSLPNKIEKRAEAVVDFTKWTVNLQVKKKN